MTIVTKKRSYGAGEFKAKCLGILDDVAKEQQTVYVTKRGKMVAAVIPPPAEIEALNQSLLGSVIYEGDLVAPIGADWEADS